MGAVVYVPFAVSVIVAALSRFAASRLWPRAAVSAIATAAAALAVASVGALVLLACPLPAQVPFVASLGRWQPGAVASHSPTPAWVSLLALALLLVLAWRAVRELRALGVELRDATQLRRAIGGPSDGAVVIVEDPVPAAHAVAGVLTRGGAVVISTSMLDILDADERAAVIAHERAHLHRHHSMFMSAVRLSAALNPLLSGMVRDMRFALERWADEDAAMTTGRPVLATALVKAALGILGGDIAAVAPTLAFHQHGVTDRVEALLTEPNRRTRPAWALIVISFAAALALAWATHNTERFFEAARVWSHQ